MSVEYHNKTSSAATQYGSHCFCFGDIIAAVGEITWRIKRLYYEGNMIFVILIFDN